MRSEATARAEELFERSCVQGFPVTVAELLDASGLLDTNNQLRQRLTEAEGLLARLAKDSTVYVDTVARWSAGEQVGHGSLTLNEAWTLVVGALDAYDAYRTKYTPEPVE